MRTLTEEEVIAGARHICARARRPQEDLVLYYLIFATGARPLEIARLEVRDYLYVTGAVRRVSAFREDAALDGCRRPLCFFSDRLDAALDAYLERRLRDQQGVGEVGQYRGLDPRSRLVVSETGDGFKVEVYGEEGQRRYRSRAMQETYRKLFRYAGIQKATALTARCTVADRLYARGADKSMVEMLLGISTQSAIDHHSTSFPLHTVLESLTRNLL